MVIYSIKYHGYCVIALPMLLPIILQYVGKWITSSMLLFVNGTIWIYKGQKQYSGNQKYVAIGYFKTTDINIMHANYHEPANYLIHT